MEGERVIFAMSPQAKHRNGKGDLTEKHTSEKRDIHTNRKEEFAAFNHELSDGVHIFRLSGTCTHLLPGLRELQRSLSLTLTHTTLSFMYLCHDSCGCLLPRPHDTGREHDSEALGIHFALSALLRDIVQEVHDVRQ